MPRQCGSSSMAHGTGKWIRQFHHADYVNLESFETLRLRRLSTKTLL